MRALSSAMVLGLLAAAPLLAQDDWGDEDDWGEKTETGEPSDPVDAIVEERKGPKLGDPVPLTRREPSVGPLATEVDLRYGLVGTGPTRLVNDVRFGLTDWLELRTSFQPYPSSLMARFQIGRQQSSTGAFLVDVGLAHIDFGLRIVPDLGEAEVGLRTHWEAALGHAIALGDAFSLFTSAHYRYRQSGLVDDEMHAVSVDSQLSYDLLPWLTLSGGLGFATTLGGPVREIAVNFVEMDRPGMNHYLLRDDPHDFSVTAPLALTYGRTESFDVDIFCTPRLAPTADVIFGAGIRWRTRVLSPKKTTEREREDG